jgi:hypothetical protein
MSVTSIDGKCGRSVLKNERQLTLIEIYVGISDLRFIAIPVNFKHLPNLTGLVAHCRRPGLANGLI